MCYILTAVLAFLLNLADFRVMSVTELAVSSPGPLLFEDLFNFWMERCEKFLQWQRKSFIDSDPTVEELAEHGKRLNMLVRFTLHVYAQAADPDAPKPDALRLIAGRLKQLEDWRSVIHNPLSEQQADAILARAFPG